MNDFIFEYSDIEDCFIDQFESDNQKANQNILATLDYFRNYLFSIKGTIIDDNLKSTIHLFMGSNFDLLFQAYCLLKRGYFRPPLILLRPVYESIILCMYFCEFPEKEEEYRNCKSKMAWYRKQNMNDGIIRKLENEGTIFNKAEQSGFFEKLIGNSLKEINKFVHHNHEYIFNSIYSVDRNSFILGPKEIDEYLRNGLIICILESAIFSMMVLEKSLKSHEKEFIEKVKGIIAFVQELRKRNTQLASENGEREE